MYTPMEQVLEVKTLTKSSGKMDISQLNVLKPGFSIAARLWNK